MAQWGNQDQASDSVLWANTTLNVAKTQSEVFGNVTEDDLIQDLIVGQFGVSTDEIANTSGEGEYVTHAGWVLRKEGTGGRAGRVQYETLVAMSSITGDAADDTQLPE